MVGEFTEFLSSVTAVETEDGVDRFGLIGNQGSRITNDLLRTYPCRAATARAACAFLKAIRPQASCSRARWFSAFFDQRTSRPRLRFSQEWAASTTQRRARQPGVRSLSSISSPRLRMCAVSP
jgi:hypothetical protein